MLVDGLPIVGLTAPTLLGITILMLLTGRLWTNKAYEEKVKESNQWRGAFEKEHEARVASDAQVRELLELAKTTHALITAVFSNSEKMRQSGGSDVPHSTSAK